MDILATSLHSGSFRISLHDGTVLTHFPTDKNTTSSSRPNNQTNLVLELLLGNL